MAVDPGRIGPSLKLAFPVLGVGIAIAIAGGIGTGVTFARSLFTSPTQSLPAHLHRHLDKGTYEVFQKIVDGGGFPASGHDFASLGPQNVQVRTAAGAPVAVEPAGDTGETIMRGSRSYAAAVQFDTPRSGDYTIDIEPDGGIPEVILTRSLGDTFRHSVRWLLTIGLGVFIAAVGLVLLVVGIVRRNRASRQAVPFTPAYGAAPAYAAAPPPAWYPDPGGSGRQRWWDGFQWTDHLN